MDVPISQRNLDHLERKVASGRYDSLDDVLDKALALLDERDLALDQELADVWQKVRQGFAEVEDGQSIPAAQVFHELRRRSAEMGQGDLVDGRPHPSPWPPPD